MGIAVIIFKMPMCLLYYFHYHSSCLSICVTRKAILPISSVGEGIGVALNERTS